MLTTAGESDDPLYEGVDADDDDDDSVGVTVASDTGAVVVVGVPGVEVVLDEARDSEGPAAVWGRAGKKKKRVSRWVV